MEMHPSTIRPDTIARWVREGKLTERESLLLRGTPSARGYRGHKYAILRWLEDFSPGVSRRVIGDTMKGWQRNVGPARAKLVSLEIQGRLRKSPGRPFPPSKFRCTAKAKHRGDRCRNWGHPWPDGTRCRTCFFHGAMAAPFGRLSGSYKMRWDGKGFSKVWTLNRKRDAG